MLSPELVDALLELRNARDWRQYHTARNVASALSVEAAELLEHFVWSSDKEVPTIAGECHAAIASEIADIAILLTYLSYDLSINLEAAVFAKMKENERKYALERSRGSNKKYTDL